MYHDVDIGDAKPVKQYAYRVNPQKRKLLQQKVTYMLDNGLIEPNHSAWSLPCLLVPKLEGSVRFCTDFRKVDALNKADSFPLLESKIALTKLATPSMSLKSIY